MKSEILSILASGAKSGDELVSMFNDDDTTALFEIIENLEVSGLVKSQSKQVHEGNNVFRWDREYQLIKAA